MPLPPTAEAARAAATAAQGRRNLLGGLVACGFVAGVIFYTTRVAVVQDEITDEEVRQFQAQRAARQRLEAAERGNR